MKGSEITCSITGLWYAKNVAYAKPYSRK